MLMPYHEEHTINVKNGRSESELPYWRNTFDELVKRHRDTDESDWSVCQKLAPMLNAVRKRKGNRPAWTPNYILSVMHRTLQPEGAEPSPPFRQAVVSVFNRKPRVRKDKPRAYVPLNSREEVALINRVPPGKRRELLLAAAKKE